MINHATPAKRRVKSSHSALRPGLVVRGPMGVSCRSLIGDGNLVRNLGRHPVGASEATSGRHRRRRVDGSQATGNAEPPDAISSIVDVSGSTEGASLPVILPV